MIYNDLTDAHITRVFKEPVSITFVYVNIDQMTLSNIIDGSRLYDNNIYFVDFVFLSCKSV